ncbi:MAG: Smr/MutS family protein [Alphaproteobacteria bacterium]|nr:Smr/MutS family protein [Alphaproteobacteria bacterium]
MAKTAAEQRHHHNDRRLWAEAVRDVTPLRGRPVTLAPSAPTEPPRGESGALPAPHQAAIGHFSGIDRANAERLKRGLRPIEAELDLHGLTQAEAHRRLVEFVEACYRDGRRCVLVITGRGLGPDGPGVLKRAVPRWLGEAGLRRRVLAIATAQPRHGGAGALYLLLRRQRRATDELRYL